MISGNYILYLLNNKGHKTTLMIGIIIEVVILPIYGFAVKFDSNLFIFICIVSNILIGFADGIIFTAANTIIAYNFPDKINILVFEMLLA